MHRLLFYALAAMNGGPFSSDPVVQEDYISPLPDALRCSLMAVHASGRSKHSASPWRPEMDAYVLLRHVRDKISLPKVAQQWPFPPPAKKSRAYPGPSSLSSSPRARTSLLMPTAIICHPVMSLLRSTLSSDTCTSTDDAGAGVPFGCVVTADNWISTGSSSSRSSSPASFRSALRSVRSVWLTLHAVNRRFIHPIFFSRSSARSLVLSGEKTNWLKVRRLRPSALFGKPAPSRAHVEQRVQQRVQQRVR